jgi:hypothetical protein
MFEEEDVAYHNPYIDIGLKHKRVAHTQSDNPRRVVSTKNSSLHTSIWTLGKRPKEKFVLFYEV